MGKFNPADTLNQFRKLVNPNNDFTKSIWQVRVDAMRSYAEAEQAVIFAFASRHGIDLTPMQAAIAQGGQAIAARGKVASDIEIVHATVIPQKEEDLSFEAERIIQESWCVDRRNGYQGYDKTYPRVQLVGKSTSLFVRIIDDPEKENINADGK